jgi:hypothetical protein
MSMSLEYTQDRRAELEENIKSVESEMPGKVGHILRMPHAACVTD